MNTCILVEGLNCSMNRLGNDAMNRLISAVMLNLKHFKRTKPDERIRLIQRENTPSVLLALDKDTCEKAEKMISGIKSYQLLEEIKTKTATIILDWNKIKPNYGFH
jgi:hypothetical protein